MGVCLKFANEMYPLSILGDFRFQMLSCNKFIIKDLNIHHSSFIIHHSR